ncbi:MAG: hypothetical protein AAF152_20755, partial [Cyanobacteria bacterium P01_A01_bin.114]
MVRFSKSFLGLILALSFTTVACNPSSDVTEPDSAETPTEIEPSAESTPGTETDETGKATEPKDPVISQDPDIEEPADLVAISIYVMDDECNDFVKQTVEVSEAQAMDEAIGKVI